jgi:hypothetical protein
MRGELTNPADRRIVGMFGCALRSAPDGPPKAVTPRDGASRDANLLRVPCAHVQGESPKTHGVCSFGGLLNTRGPRPRVTKGELHADLSGQLQRLAGRCLSGRGPLAPRAEATLRSPPTQLVTPTEGHQEVQPVERYGPQGHTFGSRGAGNDHAQTVLFRGVGAFDPRGERPRREAGVAGGDARELARRHRAPACPAVRLAADGGRGHAAPADASMVGHDARSLPEGARGGDRRPAGLCRIKKSGEQRRPGLAHAPPPAESRD